MARSQQIFDPRPHFRAEVDLQIARSQLNSAAVFQTEHQLHLALARVASHDLPQLRKAFFTMYAFVDTNLHTVGVLGVDLFDRDQLIADQIGVITTPAPIDDPTNHDHRVRLNHLPEFLEVIGPKDATNHPLDIFEVEIGIFGGRTARTHFSNMSEFDGRQHAADCDFSSVGQFCEFSAVVAAKGFKLSAEFF